MDKCTVKQMRASRGSSMQCEELVSYMENHAQFAAGRFLGYEGRTNYNKQWDQLALILNSSRNGVQKSTKQWQTVWRDLKSNSSKHAARIRRERNETGNVQTNIPPLSALEERIIGIMGTNYVEGAAKCPDSMPEEGDIQQQLEAGNSDVLLLPPKAMSITEYADNLNEEFLDIETPETETIATASGNDATPIDSELQNTTAGPSRAPSSERKMGCKQRNLLQCTSGRRRQRGNKFNAQQQFVQIAEKNAAAQQMLAEAALLTARNEQRRIEVEERRIANEEKFANIFETLTYVVDKLADGFR